MPEGGPPRDSAALATTLLAALARYRAGVARDGGEYERGPTPDAEWLRDERGISGEPGRRGERESGAGAECLLERVPEIETMAGHQRRRIELVERAVTEERIERGLAEEAYDLAREEGLEPAFGLELVRCGIAVCEPPDSDLVETSAVRGHPEWLEPPVPGAEATRERRLRMSFRRLRRLLEERPTAEEALTAFAKDPDVQACGY
jgi:hypothetical protein